MGFERLVRVIQEKTSNYDTDIFMPIIEAVEKLSGKKYGFSDSKSDIAFRVIADHIRAISFTIADGQIPSNTGAGYVIRRILRRAVRYGYSFLDFQAPFMHQLVELLASQFANVFPELTAQKDYLTQVIREEENSFFATLSKGIKIFNDLTANNAKSISGKDAFTLYDTYGFPFDLTQLMAQEAGIQVDEAAFEQELQIQKDRSKNATKLETEDWEIINPELDGKATQFIGYTDYSCDSKIVKIRKVAAKNQVFYQIVLDKTPFYAESGGQVGDSGSLILGNQSINIYNTVKENDTIFHLTKEIEVADLKGVFLAQINKAKRSLTTKNHSATHLLQASLRNVLGAHVEQKGSLVNEKLLRFDFSHFAKLTDEEIAKLEQMVNAKIQAQIDLKEEQNIPIEEAKSRGVMALFGEKYGEFVRVITFDASFSQELCGGTHVNNTGEIEYFKIISESSISAGVRRIEAITSQAVLEYYQGKEAQLDEIATAMKNPQKLLPAIQNLMQETANQRKTIEQYEKYIVQAEVQKISDQLSNATGAYIEMNEFSSDIIKNIATQLRAKHDDLAMALVYEEKEKLKVAIAISDAVQASKSLMANQLAKEIGQTFQGGGGGQPGFSVVTLDMNTSKEALASTWQNLVQK
jgi:alanyl-tRNA synthetase